MDNNNVIFERLDKKLIESDSKIIHQIWFGTFPTKKKAMSDYKKYEKYRQSWKINNPGWTYQSWDLDMCRKLIYNFYPEHMEMFFLYNYDIQRCDSIRYFILHRYGGIYADMDYICCSPWDKICQIYTGDVYIVETPNKVGGNSSIQISNSLMFSKYREHIFWKKLFIELEKHRESNFYFTKHIEIMFTAGPGRLDNAYHTFGKNLGVSYYPYKEFHPYGITSDIMSIKKRSGIHAMHISKGTWSDNDTLCINFVYREIYIIMFIIVCTIILPRVLKFSHNNFPIKK